VGGNQSTINRGKLCGWGWLKLNKIPKQTRRALLMKEKLSVCFQGWINIDWDSIQIVNKDSNRINKERYSREELIKKFNNKELHIDFIASVRDCDEYGIELFDYENREN
jgi:hypothetical protein